MRMETNRQPRFKVGDHVFTPGFDLCGTVATVFETRAGAVRVGWAYGVIYDDHANPSIERAGVFVERDLELVPEEAA